MGNVVSGWLEQVSYTATPCPRVHRCLAGHAWASYLPRCPWCSPIPKHKGA